MVSFVVVGSCLVGMPAAYLMGEYKWKRLNQVKIDRSDLFLADFVDRTTSTPPREEILSFASPLPEHEKDFLERLDECYPETIGMWQCGEGYVPLQQNLRAGNIDIILMDNLLETTLNGLKLNTPAGLSFATTLPFQFCVNADEIFARNARAMDHLTAEESVENWVRIIEFFRKNVPQVEIVFACAPYSLSGDDLQEFRRRRDFYLLFKDQAEALDVKVIPPLDVDPQYTKLPDDRSHFDNLVYKAMAGHIAMCHLAKLTGVGQAYICPDTVFGI